MMNLLLPVVASEEAAALLNFHMILSLLTLTLIALISAAFSLFLDYLLDDHPIGQWYLYQIQKLPTLWAKPLGECPYCSGAWQFLVISCLIFNQPFYLCSIFLGVNHLFLLLLSLMQKRMLSLIRKNQGIKE
jgi:hypothetical protein